MPLFGIIIQFTCSNGKTFSFPWFDWRLCSLCVRLLSSDVSPRRPDPSTPRFKAEHPFGLSGDIHIQSLPFSYKSYHSENACRGRAIHTNDLFILAILWHWNKDTKVCWIYSNISGDRRIFERLNKWHGDRVQHEH